MRSTAENENYKDRDGPPNEFSHRRARNLLLSTIARLCAKNVDLWPLGGAVGFPGGGEPWNSNWSNWAGRWAGLCTTQPGTIEAKRATRRNISANLCGFTLGQKHDLRSDREWKEIATHWLKQAAPPPHKTNLPTGVYC